MKTVKDLQLEINKLVKAGNYKEALSSFKINKVKFDRDALASNYFLMSDMLRCLKMTNSHQAAMKFMDIYNISIDKNTNRSILTAWALVIYDWYKKENEKENVNLALVLRMISSLKTMMPLLKGLDTDFAYDFYNNITLKIIKTEGKRNNINWKLIADFCESVDENYLSTSCNHIKMTQKGKEKDTEMASTKEEWYVIYSKSLYATEKYEACIDICKKALANIDKFHYSNEIWLERRIAQCCVKMNEMDKARSIYEKILQQKNEWFILSELGDIYYATGLYDQAQETMKYAMTKYGDLSFKIELIEKLGDVFAKLEENDLSRKHYLLSIAIRTVEGWKVSERLRSKVTDYDEGACWADIKNNLVSELKTVWTKGIKKTGETTVLTGQVQKLSPPKDLGKDIWIKTDDGQQYYSFVKKTDSIFHSLSKGVKVSFKIKKQPGKQLDGAFNIRLI